MSGIMEHSLMDFANIKGVRINTTRNAVLPHGASDALCRMYNTYWGQLTYTHMDTDAEGNHYITGSWLDTKQFVEDLLYRQTWGSVRFYDVTGYYAFSDLLYSLGLQAKQTMINGQAALCVCPQPKPTTTFAAPTVKESANIFYYAGSKIPHPFKEIEFSRGSINKIFNEYKDIRRITERFNLASRNADISNYKWINTANITDITPGKILGLGGNNTIIIEAECSVPLPPQSAAQDAAAPAPEGTPYKMSDELAGLLAADGIEPTSVTIKISKKRAIIMKDDKYLGELDYDPKKDYTAEQWHEYISELFTAGEEE